MNFLYMLFLENYIYCYVFALIISTRLDALTFYTANTQLYYLKWGLFRRPS